MSSSLKEKCGKFINNKYPNTYRNTIDYINKTNMKNNGVWGGDLELFTAGLLFNTIFGCIRKKREIVGMYSPGKVLQLIKY